MSSSEYSKCVTVNESYIPIAKRSYTGAKKAKGCAQLPELQKYIETIIKSSNECDSEDTSKLDKDKVAKERKVGRQTVPRGNDSKIKQNLIKSDLNKRKTKTKPKTPVGCEAVSSGVEILNKFVTEFEDPRNWKINRTQNLGPSLRIENFLKKLYPNPYNLANVNEFKNSKTEFIFEKVEKDDLRDGTLPDVVISKVDAQTEVDFEKPDNVLNADTQIDIEITDNAIQNAENDINPNERENPTENITPAPTSENCDQSPTQISQEKEDPEVLTTVSDPMRKPSKPKNLNPKSKINSRTSSLESLSDLSSKENKKRKNVKVKDKTNSRESLKNISESTLQQAESLSFKEGISDYDIGKLKLLSMSDSDDSASKKFQMKQVEKSKDDFTDDPVSQTNSETCEDFTKNNELNELLQIYNVMNKATESFLLISSKNELLSSEFDILQNLEEEKSLQFLSDLSEEPKPPCQENEGNIQIYCPDDNSNKEEIKNSRAFSSLDKSKVEEDENDLQNISHKEELQLRKKTEESSSDAPKPKPKDEKEFLEAEEEFKKFDSLDKFEEKKEENVQKTDLDTNQKIDEVLQFMYDCLIRFNNQEKLLHEREKNFLQETKTAKKLKKYQKEIMADLKQEKPSMSELFKKNNQNYTTERDSCESLSAKSLPDVKEVRSKYTAALGELSRKHTPKMHTKKRLENSFSGIPVAEKRSKPPMLRPRIPVTDSDTFSTFELDLQSLPLPDSFGVNNENYIQTVESQNELGGFEEETITIRHDSGSDIRISKPVLPLSVKVKRSKTDTRKTLKDVLETEEKLLAGGYADEKLEHGKIGKKNSSELICTKSSQILLQNKAISTYSIEDDFEPSNSNFLICINPFPRNLRTVTITPNISPPPPLTISLSDIKTWDLKPLTYFPKHRLKKLSIPSEKKYCAMRLSYKVEEEIILTINKTVEAYTATPVCVKAIINFSKQLESSLKKSECYVKVKPIKKSLFVEKNNLDLSKSHLKSALTLKSSMSNLIPSSCSGLNDKSQDEKSAEALLQALKETEEKVYRLEKSDESAENLYKSSDSLCSYSETELLRVENLHNEKKESNAKKVEDLMLRTYNLQQKLHRYLHKITYMQPKTLSCPLIQKEQFLDFGMFIRDKSDSNLSLTELDINPENNFPLMHCYVQPPANEKNSKADEATVVSVHMVDCGTSYNPPSEENSKTQDELSRDAKYVALSEKGEACQDDEDDRSSNCSFKSSNDFSESNDNQNVSKETADHSSQELIEKLYNKIESFWQSFEKEKLRNQEKKESNDASNEKYNLKQLGELKENRLVEYDHGKTTAKVLKTVFKGRKSSTELTIGLKDVPMTKVNNISVEKKKFSPNHTKISICISKEKPDELGKPNRTNKELLHNKFSSYYFDRLRPSLSTCRTEYSRLNDDISKSSQSLNELNKGSDEDEDDYKSVGSSINESDLDGANEEKLKPKEQTTVDVPPPKPFSKHRFEFYRKLDLNKEDNKPRQTTLTNTWSRYKELEPLKQALTEMQIRMRSIKRDAILSSNEYYERALKLAKMSAGFCQSCGTRAVIPEDTFGFYKTLLPRRCAHSHRNRHIRTALTPNSSFYSFRSSNAEVNDQFCDLNIKHSSSYLLNRMTHLRSSLHDMPILFERL